MRYLSEGNYQEAILAFEAAIEIDPKNADAYRKLAEAYEQTGDENAALRALRDGAEATGDQTLAGQVREKQQELLESSFPAALSPDCTEYVSYEPGSGARQQEQPDDLAPVPDRERRRRERPGVVRALRQRGEQRLVRAALLCASRVRRRDAAGRTDASGNGRV